MTPAEPDESGVDVEVTDNRAARRYEARLDGVLVGLTNYRLRDDRVEFTHAEVYPRWEGHGVGSALARAALDDVVSQGKLISPRCPFIVSYVQHHPAYLEHVDVSDRAMLASESTGHEKA